LEKGPTRISRGGVTSSVGGGRRKVQRSRGAKKNRKVGQNVEVTA